jgi:hypothetical protein
MTVRFAEKRSFNMNDIQILSIVEQAVPTMSIALTSHHCTRWGAAAHCID